MAGKVRHLLERAGRYHARIVVPKRLHPTLKKVELSVALGADRREALRKLPAVVARISGRLHVHDSDGRRASPSEACNSALGQGLPQKVIERFG
jgi:hypothetical protein